MLVFLLRKIEVQIAKMRSKQRHGGLKFLNEISVELHNTIIEEQSNEDSFMNMFKEPSQTPQMKKLDLSGLP